MAWWIAVAWWIPLKFPSNPDLEKFQTLKPRVQARSQGEPPPTQHMPGTGVLPPALHAAAGGTGGTGDMSGTSGTSSNRSSDATGAGASSLPSAAALAAPSALPHPGDHGHGHGYSHNPHHGHSHSIHQPHQSQFTTPSHAAPELFATPAPPPSFESDMYALGVVLWELVTGSRPYSSYRRVAEIIAAKARPTAEQLPFPEARR
jgi:serine/threonine protein kinase